MKDFKIDGERTVLGALAKKSFSEKYGHLGMEPIRDFDSNRVFKEMKRSAARAKSQVKELSQQLFDSIKFNDLKELKKICKSLLVTDYKNMRNKKDQCPLCFAANRANIEPSVMKYLIKTMGH